MTTKYLIIGPSWIGDMIMANALLRCLKAQDSRCVIDVLAPEWSHPVLARMPEVRRALVMPVKHGIFGWRMRYKIGISLRDEHYDHAIILPNSWKSALIPLFACIKKRTGWRGEWRYGLLNDVRVLDKKKFPLMVDRYVELGRIIGAGDTHACPPNVYPHLLVDPNQRDIALKKYHFSQDKPLLILCPGAQYGNSKRWPEENFAKVARHFLDQGWQVAVLGGNAEANLANQIIAAQGLVASDHQIVDLTMTTLAEAIDIMSLARVVVSNDSGLMHIACALTRSIVAIYGSSSPDFTPPLSDKAVILSKSLPCKPCFKRECPLGHMLCLKNITPEEVIGAIKTLL